MTTNPRLCKELNAKKCERPQDFRHDPIEGSLTELTGRYPEGLANLVVASLAPDLSFEHVPAMPCIKQIDHGHRVRFPDDLSTMPSAMAGVTKLLSRNEMFQDLQALKAIAEEGEGVRSMETIMETWRDDTVVEKGSLLDEARKTGQQIHVAEVMSIASVKHWETPSRRKYKGRL